VPIYFLDPKITADKCQQLLNSLQSENRASLEQKTRNQANCEHWREEKRKRLTASTIRRVITMKRVTNPSKFIQSSVFPSNYRGTKAMIEGLKQEMVSTGVII
jgi:hypothetical protein